MAHIVKLLIKGLFSNPNQLSEQPEGALQAAENLVIDRESVAELRRGLKQFGEPGNNGLALIEAFDTVLFLDETTLKYNNTGNGTFSSYSGNYAAPSNVRMRGTDARKNFYFTTSNGIYKLDALASTPAPSGSPPGLDIQASLTGSSGFLPDNSAVAYRMLWKKTDANLNEVLGAPSARVILPNDSGNNANVNVSFTVPVGLDTSWNYQVFRSVTGLSASVDPGDDLYLCYEKALTSGNISAGFVTFTDIVPDENLRDPLYTNETQEGILQANYEPPLAKDLTYVASLGCMMYANTESKPQLQLTMLATPAVNSTVTVDSIVFTAKNSENVAANQFKTFTGGSPAEDIAATIESLVKCINRAAYNSGGNQNTTTWAYLADPTLPTIQIKARAFGDSFSANSSVPGSWAEVLPLNSTTEANNDEIFVSKPGEVEACPILQRYRIGLAGKRILRVLAIQDATIVLKEDGAWRITGTEPGALVVEPINKTYEFTAPETGAAADNMVFGCTTQGPVAVTPTQVVPIAMPIEIEMKRFITLSNFDSLAWGCSYIDDKKYLIGVPSAPSNPDIAYVYVYSTKTGGWTRWPMRWRAATVVDNKLYALRLTDQQILQERKALTVNDYADDEFSVTIESISGNTLQLGVGNTAPLLVGDTIVKGGARGILTSVNLNTYQVTIADTTGWTTGVATVYRPIEGILRWSEEDAGSPGIFKHWQQLILLFEKTRFTTATVRVATEVSVGFKAVEVAPRNQGKWGRFPWGRLPWGRGLGLFQPIRTWFPRETSRSLWCSIEVRTKQAFTSFSLLGATIDCEPHQVTRFK